MIKRYLNDDLVWFDVYQPTTEDIQKLVDEDLIPLEMSNDLTTPTPYSDAVYKKGFLKITLDLPIVKRTDIDNPHEVKLIASKKALISIRFEDIQVIDIFRRKFELSELLGQSTKTVTGGVLLLNLLGRFYDSLEDKLNHLISRVNDIEREILKGQEKQMVEEISTVSRRLIAFRQAVSSHEKPIKRLPEGISLAFKKPYESTAVSIIKHYEYISERIEKLSSSLNDLRETNNSLLNTKQNEIMKTLTVMAFVTFPLTVLTSMFGMNAVDTPIVGRDGDFWLIFLIMVLFSICLFFYFKFKKWM